MTAAPPPHEPLEWDEDRSDSPAHDPGVPAETAVDHDEYAIDVSALYAALVSVNVEEMV